MSEMKSPKLKRIRPRRTRPHVPPALDDRIESDSAAAAREVSVADEDTFLTSDQTPPVEAPSSVETREIAALEVDTQEIKTQDTPSKLSDDVASPITPPRVPAKSRRSRTLTEKQERQTVHIKCKHCGERFFVRARKPVTMDCMECGGQIDVNPGAIKRRQRWLLITSLVLFVAAMGGTIYGLSILN